MRAPRLSSRTTIPPMVVSIRTYGCSGGSGAAAGALGAAHAAKTAHAAIATVATILLIYILALLLSVPSVPPAKTYRFGCGVVLRYGLIFLKPRGKSLVAS